MNMKASQIARDNPFFLVGQSIVLGEIKAEVPAHDEEPREAQIVLQKVEQLSPEKIK